MLWLGNRSEIGEGRTYSRSRSWWARLRLTVLQRKPRRGVPLMRTSFWRYYLGLGGLPGVDWQKRVGSRVRSFRDVSWGIYITRNETVLLISKVQIVFLPVLMAIFWLIICKIGSHALPSQIGSCPCTNVVYNGFDRCTSICVKHHDALQITPRVMSIAISTGCDRVAESLFLSSCRKGALVGSAKLK